MVYGAFIAVITYYILVFVRKARTKGESTFYTKNKWGNKKDLKETGLLCDKGVVLGQTLDAKVKGTMAKGSCRLKVKKPGDLVAFDTNVSALVLAGSRLGKGVSTVIPTHLSFPYSIISIDPKGENYEITAGFRRKFSHVLKFNPVDKETLCFNVMDEIEENFAFRDANTIAKILTQEENPQSSADPHWRDSACSLITAAILHCKCSSYKDKSIPGVYRFLTSYKKGGEVNNNDGKREILKKMLHSTHCTYEIHECIENFAGQLLSAPDNELGSIFSTALTCLSVFNDPLVANATRKSDFCLNDFKTSDIPISWYLTIPFSDLSRLKNLLRLIIEFVCRKFSQGLVNGAELPLKNRILFLIDEFPTLGKMETIEEFAGILNGYGISFLWIAQSKNQIDKLYGRDAALFEHCHYICTYAVGDGRAAEYFSNRIGKEGVIKQNTSNNGNRYDVMMNNVTVSNDITQRSLLTANEIESLPCEYEIIITQGGLPQLCKKNAYYSDPRFKDKVNLPVPKNREEMLKEAAFSLVTKKKGKDWSFVEEDNKYKDLYDNEKDIKEFYVRNLKINGEAHG